MKSQLNQKTDSAAERKTAQSETQNVPKLPVRGEKTPASKFNKGEVRVRKVRDNRKNSGGIHNVLEYKDGKGVTRTVVPTRVEWDNNTDPAAGEPKLIVDIEINGEVREYYLTLTEKV